MAKDALTRGERKILLACSKHQRWSFQPDQFVIVNRMVEEGVLRRIVTYKDKAGIEHYKYEATQLGHHLLFRNPTRKSSHVTARHAEYEAAALF